MKAITMTRMAVVSWPLGKLPDASGRTSHRLAGGRGLLMTCLTTSASVQAAPPGQQHDDPGGQRGQPGRLGRGAGQPGEHGCGRAEPQRLDRLVDPQVVAGDLGGQREPAQDQHRGQQRQPGLRLHPRQRRHASAFPRNGTACKGSARQAMAWHTGTHAGFTQTVEHLQGL
jgi:hypothetical protein